MAGSSSNPNSHMVFDVFISFNRDEEDENYRRFRKELYENLCGWGMKVFMDDDHDNDDEDNVSDKIVKAIEGSKTCIVVLSKGYASSKLCLRELVKIHKTTYQVLPLFCIDKTSNISFGCKYFFCQALRDFIRNDPKNKNWKEIHGWTDAMSQISSLSGVVLQPLILLSDTRKIRKMIFDKLLNLKLEAKNSSLFEMEHRLRTMEMLLGVGSKEVPVRLIGIVGMGGIGKTTIAELLYDKFAPTFRHNCCFLHISGSNIVSLQQQLLSQLFFLQDIKICDESVGVERIKHNLRSCQKVLLVFDGITEKSQLEMLAGSPDWFPAESRIIVTTRNKHILRQINFKHKVQEYNVELLSHTSAFSLFCKHAFRRKHPPDDNFQELSNEIIEKVGTLPLAVLKIASSLYGQGIDVWEDTLKGYHKLVYDNIFSDVLKSSYGGLEAESQQIFLDLACFLNGEKVDRVTEILQGFGYNSPDAKLQLLADICLIDISNEHIQIHILILCMAQELVRRKLGTHQQTRIWLREDASRVFHENYDLKCIQGIKMDLEEEEELVLEAKSFADMTELKILQINNVQISEDIECLSNKLTLLNWPGYPSKYLPSTFQPLPLLELHLPGSKVEQLWNGTKKFGNLKEIDASDSKYLVETPDFSEVRNLRRLILRNCGRLQEVHSSINSLKRLVLLNMEGCVSFTRFLFAITCKRLKTLLLSNSGLEFFPEFGCYMEYLTELHVDGTFINQLSPSITYLTALVLLNLRNCIRLSSLPVEMDNLRSVKTLILSGCKNLDQIPPSLGNVKPLEELDIGGTSISVIPFLENLRILNCERLKSNIWHSLASLPTQSFRSLEDLNLSDCNLVDEDIPNDLELFSSLEILDLSSNHFERLSESVEQLINLKALYLNDCHKLKQVPKLPPSLRYVGGEKSLDMLRNSQGSPACTISPSTSNAPMLTNIDYFLNDVEQFQEYRNKEVDIVKDKWKQSDHTLVLSYKTSFVGIENQVEKVRNLLDLERPNDILFVGIFGSSGIGKTSIAEVVYNTIIAEFESGCFLYLSSKQNSLVPRQHQMFSELLSEETKICDEDHGARLIKHHMSNRKVLIVLDGVDETRKIQNLAGSPDWFGAGSRVIITSRNRDVLDQLNYRDEVQEYNVELLSHESAYSLFCKYAFRNRPCDKKELCNEIVEKVGRLPLALKTIGSYLHNKELVVWNETLKRLDEVEQDFFDTILQRSRKNLHKH